MRSLSGYFVAVISRPSRTAALLTLVVATTLLSGCAPAPEPTPTATPAFASEEEAFAAAEEVYRAYNEAGNARIAGESSPDPQDFLVGEALEADIETLRAFAEQGIRLEGVAAVDSVTGESVTDRTVIALICVNAGGVRVVNSNGEDVTPADRPDKALLEVTFEEVESALVISDSELADSSC